MLLHHNINKITNEVKTRKLSEIELLKLVGKITFIAVKNYILSILGLSEGLLKMGPIIPFRIDEKFTKISEFGGKVLKKSGDDNQVSS